MYSVAWESDAFDRPAKKSCLLEAFDRLEAGKEGQFLLSFISFLFFFCFWINLHWCYLVFACFYVITLQSLNISLIRTCYQQGTLINEMIYSSYSIYLVCFLVFMSCEFGGIHIRMLICFSLDICPLLTNWEGCALIVLIFFFFSYKRSCHFHL